MADMAAPSRPGGLTFTGHAVIVQPRERRGKDPMTESPVTFEASDGVGWVTLNRPAVLNALSTELVMALADCAARAAADAPGAQVGGRPRVLLGHGPDRTRGRHGRRCVLSPLEPGARLPRGHAEGDAGRAARLLHRRRAAAGAGVRSAGGYRRRGHRPGRHAPWSRA